MTQGPSPEVVEMAHRMFDLARDGETATLAAYVEAGVPPDLTDPRGNTLLMLAAYHGHAETVRALAQAGAGVDAVNDRGQSPLAGAVFKGEHDVVTSLLELGADPDRGTPTARETAVMFEQDYFARDQSGSPRPANRSQETTPSEGRR